MIDKKRVIVYVSVLVLLIQGSGCKTARESDGSLKFARPDRLHVGIIGDSLFRHFVVEDSTGNQQPNESLVRSMNNILWQMTTARKKDDPVDVRINAVEGRFLTYESIDIEKTYQNASRRNAAMKPSAVPEMVRSFGYPEIMLIELGSNGISICRDCGEPSRDSVRTVVRLIYQEYDTISKIRPLIYWINTHNNGDLINDHLNWLVASGKCSEIIVLDWKSQAGIGVTEDAHKVEDRFLKDDWLPVQMFEQAKARGVIDQT